MRPPSLLLPLALAAACTAKDSVPIDDTASETTGRYDPDHLTVVQGELSEDEWTALLQETRLFYEIIMGPDCFQEPPPNVFEYHPGTVTIDGETLVDVGFRKKGFIGSLSWTRPSLKIDSDRFVDGQEFADSTEHFTFNNNNQDPSRLHTCLAYSVFQAAGVPAPDCAFATVAVNGEDLGVYSNVEPIKKAFLRDNFGSDEGDLYEGTSSDFAPEFLVTFEIKSDGSTLAPLEELADALELPDDELMEALDGIVDVDAFITFWAVEGLIAHWDGYANGRNNFYVYHNPGDGLLHFIPWGADAVFQDPDEDPGYLSGQLALRLYNHPDGQDRMYAEMARLLREVWDEAGLLVEIDRMEALVSPHLLDPSQSAAAVDEVRAFVQDRRATVQAVLDEAPPSQPFTTPLRYCLDPIGTVSGTFELEWAEDLDGELFEGDATLEGEVYGESLLNDQVGVLAGPNEYGEGILVLVGVDNAFTEYVQVVLVIPPVVEPGTWDVDIAAVTGYVLEGDIGGSGSEIVGLMGGEVTFDEISFVPGEPISGSIDALIIPNIFD